MLHQSEAYYEHCHAADLDPSRSTEERIACWTAWVEHYREAMPPERVLHARRRLAGLEDGLAPAPLPHVTPAFSATFLALESAPSAAVTVPTAAPTARSEEPHAAGVGGGSTNADELRDQRVGGHPMVASAPEAAVTPSPPPTTAETDAQARGRPLSLPRPMAPRANSPTHPCTAVCLPRWNHCVGRANGRGPDGLEACRIEHRVCLQGCM